MTLLFNGSFNGTEQRNGLHGAVGVYQESCIAQDGMFSIIPASTLPGNRPGYAAKFYQPVGSRYDCATNQHLLITNNLPKIPSTSQDVWYGYSMMFPNDFLSQGDGTDTNVWCNIGLGIETAYTGLVANTGLTLLIGDTPATKNHITLMITRTYTKILTDNPFGVWNDWIYHINWQKDNTGFVEIYFKRGRELNYSLLYSRYNFQTEWTDYGIPITENYLNNRIGSYRTSRSVNPQTYYIMDFKMGTTRQDVEYGSSQPCPTPMCDYTITQI